MLPEGSSDMKHFVFIGTKDSPEFIGKQYKISYFNPFKFVQGKEFTEIKDVDLLYRSNNKAYLDLLNSFFKEFKNVDVIIANWINPFHPEWLLSHFPNTVKIYGCIDDPVSTYTRTTGSIWAFDGAFYSSPGYDDSLFMSEFLDKMGIESYWWPMSWGKVTENHIKVVQDSWGSKTKGVIYIGNLYGPKFNRLVKFKKNLGKDFNIYGRWPLNGYAGMLLGPVKFFGRLGGCSKADYFPYRVKQLSESEKTAEYLKHKICFNLHYSEKRETGNIRMFESVYYGNMLLCDKAAQNAHEVIFKDNKEAIFYEDIFDAIEKAQYFLVHDNEREKIAKAGFERYCREYDYDRCLLDFLNWAGSINIKRNVC
jgi:glycosyltransferase involved in cell wall biosynthesis